jgi:hypothetical protein
LFDYDWEEGSWTRRAEITHPNVASLVHPLFAFGGKRVEEKFKPSIAMGFKPIAMITTNIITLFIACEREGRQAKRCRGESSSPY